VAGSISYLLMVSDAAGSCKDSTFAAAESRLSLSYWPYLCFNRRRQPPMPLTTLKLENDYRNQSRFAQVPRPGFLSYYFRTQDGAGKSSAGSDVI